MNFNYRLYRVVKSQSESDTENITFYIYYPDGECQIEKAHKTEKSIWEPNNYKSHLIDIIKKVWNYHFANNNEENLKGVINFRTGKNCIDIYNDIISIVLSEGEAEFYENYSSAVSMYSSKIFQH